MFTLQSARQYSDGILYNPYKVEAVFSGWKLKSLAVIKLIAWE